MLHNHGRQHYAVIVAKYVNWQYCQLLMLHSSYNYVLLVATEYLVKLPIIRYAADHLCCWLVMLPVISAN